MWSPGETRVVRASRIALQVVPGSWDFADRHASEIASHWTRRVAERPRFFNGTVHLLSSYTLSADGRLMASLVRSDYASFLYWREHGWPDRSVMDVFGAALILSADGRVLVAQQRSGHLNEGLVYPPSGFIDTADVGTDGSIDIDASVAREVAEETGLDGTVLTATGSYLLAMAGPVLAIGVPFRSALSADALADRVARFIAADPESELDRVLFLEPGPPLPSLKLPDHARGLIAALPQLQKTGL